MFKFEVAKSLQNDVNCKKSNSFDNTLKRGVGMKLKKNMHYHVDNKGFCDLQIYCKRVTCLNTKKYNLI